MGGLSRWPGALALSLGSLLASLKFILFLQIVILRNFDFSCPSLLIGGDYSLAIVPIHIAAG
jgi:hypothetical protein